MCVEVRVCGHPGWREVDEEETEKEGGAGGGGGLLLRRSSCSLLCEKTVFLNVGGEMGPPALVQPYKEEPREKEERNLPWESSPE